MKIKIRRHYTRRMWFTMFSWRRWRALWLPNHTSQLSCTFNCTTVGVAAVQWQIKYLLPFNCHPKHCCKTDQFAFHFRRIFLWLPNVQNESKDAVIRRKLIPWRKRYPVSLIIHYARKTIPSNNFRTWLFVLHFSSCIASCVHNERGLGGSVGCAVRLETRRLRVQPPPRSATFFRGDWSWNIFYSHSLPSADLRRAAVSFWRKNVHNTG